VLISLRFPSEGYDRFFEDFYSPLMRQIRQESYGDDIGQFSWVTKKDLESDVASLHLTNASRFLDVGCGPGGVLTSAVELIRCHATGIDLSAPAIAAAQRRAASLGIEDLLSLQQSDLNQPLPFPNASFDAAVSFDVILHLRDRLSVFREIKRMLVPGGRFLFTDAGVITGAVSVDELQLRAAHGYTQFVPPEFNESALKEAGFEVLEVVDRAKSILDTASGRLNARQAHEQELKNLEGAAHFETEQEYLAVVIDLTQRRALSRLTYLAKSGVA
jgi:SAM-dependent methyltransferase